MERVTYLTLEQVLVIHEDQIERYGGISGLRDLTLLESAVFRPQSTFSGKDLYESHFDKAAALMHSLIKNHPFIDGNKRTATVATLVYLSLNNKILVMNNTELVRTVVRIETENWTIKKIANWLINKI